MYIQQTGAKVYLENKCWSKVDSCKAGESIGRTKKKKERERKEAKGDVRRKDICRKKQKNY